MLDSFFLVLILSITMGKAQYLGIDLGTTNSAASLFDGDKLTAVRTSSGEVLTPSVVRIDKKGVVSVGSRARKFIVRDEHNTRAEFKRLMGSRKELEFPGAALRKTPEQLAAYVLDSIKKDVEAQSGFVPEQAVIAVPALFELPQVRATTEAARLAGFSRVETIQEPVASALASGWNESEAGGSWLVYDLGGGTFDASLLDSREGLLRVVGHDGDNFLGGKDFDLALSLVLATKLKEMTGIALDRGNPEHLAAFSRLKALAEEAKMELSRTEGPVEVLLDGFEVDGQEVELVECSLSRAELEQACLPLVDRTISVCERLLREHSTRDLERIVLVGGPTVIPVLRARLAEKLGAPFEVGLDPMTLVAEGAALFAASSGLEVTRKTKAVSDKGPRLWLQYPAMTPDLSPFIVGRCLDELTGVRAVRFVGVEHDFDSDWVDVEADGTFSECVLLRRRSVSRFRVTVRLADGREVEASPSEVSLVHGVSVGDPPLPRGIGVARADDSVAQYFERGTPLPCRKTFTHRTVEKIDPRSEGYALRVPIVQGDFPFAHLCRLVGVIEIPADALKRPLPNGSLVELTIEVDRGGSLSVKASIPSQELVFEHVEALVAPETSVDEMMTLLAEQRERGNSLRSRGFQLRDATIVALLNDFEATHASLRRDIEAARSGDPDAAEKARRSLIDADGLLGDVEARLAWPELSEEAYELHTEAAYMVQAYGTEVERQSLQVSSRGIERALRSKNPKEVERLLRSLRMIRTACYLRSPGAWNEQLDLLSGQLDRASDPKTAQRLLTKGRKAEEKGDKAGVERCVRELWNLFPDSDERRSLGFNSGVK